MDEHISEALLTALQPTGIEVSLEAERLSNEQRRRERESVSLALEKGRYEADRCRRQFEAVEPENRLVATELERRWNAALSEVNRLDQALQQKEKEVAPLAAAEAARLQALGADLGAAWDHRDAPPELKKRILRTVIEEIIVRIDPKGVTTTTEQPPALLAAANDIADQSGSSAASESTVTLTIHWVGGAHTSLSFRKPTHKHHPFSTGEDVIELVRKLSVTCSDQQIASILNRGGHRTGKGLRWKEHNVQHVRLKYQIPVYKEASRSWMSLEQAAAELSMAPQSVKRLIDAGIIPAQQIAPNAPWMIAPESLRLPQVIKINEQLKRTGRLILPCKTSNNLELSLHADQN